MPTKSKLNKTAPCIVTHLPDGCHLIAGGGLPPNMYWKPPAEGLIRMNDGRVFLKIPKSNQMGQLIGCSLQGNEFLDELQCSRNRVKDEFIESLREADRQGGVRYARSIRDLLAEVLH